MKLVLAPPSGDDLIRLLKAWRFWLLGAVAGAFLGAALYLVAPPVYRARATVTVDFHLEQAWPQNTDREQFYYLERETRKLEELAMSDAVLNAVAADVGNVTPTELRTQILQLSQPGNGGWHLFADSPDRHKAEKAAAAWATEFTIAVQTEVAHPSSGLEQYITAWPTEVEGLVARRTASMSTYMFSGAVLMLVLAALAILFVQRPR